MKYYIILFLMLFSKMTFALSPGLCKALPLTKKYISFPSNSTIFPKSFAFNCDYECMASDGKVEIITGKSELTLGSANPHGLLNILRKNQEAEARRLVCQGVKVKTVPWGFEFDYVKPFYAHTSLTNEVKAWANRKVDLNNPLEIKKLRELRVNLLKSAKSFVSAGSNADERYAYFGEAGTIINEIALELPFKTNLLNKLLAQYKEMDGVLPPNNTSLGLVFQQLKILAAWKLPLL
jgi:hypothetical protein